MSDSLRGTIFEKLYPGAFKKNTWEEDFLYRIRSGGTDRAATMFANGLRDHADDQRDLPPFDARTGVPPKRKTP